MQPERRLPQPPQVITINPPGTVRAVHMSCYHQTRFYIGGLRAEVADVSGEVVHFTVTLETSEGVITRCYAITQEQVTHLTPGRAII